MAKKTWSLKKVMMKKDQLWPWKISGIKWKRGLDFQLNIIDNLVFKLSLIDFHGEVVKISASNRIAGSSECYEGICADELRKKNVSDQKG
ncbi:hypothetical protein NC653_014491 [Populus alba x Populus x berolinensis]|uniref:Uncharacterized protein n=1 Tax=Populus alba x Populus x berolinensis TaxID=444605 RepID=A0AAD6W4Z2_9ROSI|nr:hypothetical protein NC653_014491 [Populus alba x Populus x berolinensis]